MYKIMKKVTLTQRIMEMEAYNGEIMTTKVIKVQRM